MVKPDKEKVECPPCEWCGARTVSRGHEMYATEPHWRNKFTCTSDQCGHSFCIKIKKEDGQAADIQKSDSELRKEVQTNVTE